MERRAPLVPEHVQELIEQHGIQVVVESSPERVFSDEAYRRAGARVQSHLRDVPIIFGIKEIPPDYLEPRKVYIYFSHTIKGQPQNMPMLRRLVELQDTLIDYEKITDERGKRLIAFGYYAGVAGMIDTLWALGQRLRLFGLSTPFAQIRRAYQYTSYDEAKDHLRRIGETIRRNGLPDALVPLTVGFTGHGNVSHGAQDVLDLFPVEGISPEELGGIRRTARADRIYKVVFDKAHRVAPREPGKPFDEEEYYAHPERYRSIFENYLPYLVVVVNGVYWEPRYPRLITKEGLRRLWLQGKDRHPLVIGDITCDVEGSVEITVKATDPEHPTFVYDPLTGAVQDGLEGRGVVVMAVDILPSELPRDASYYFSSILKGFVPAIARADYTVPYERLALPPELKRAVILLRGAFTPPFRYMEAFLKER